MRFDSVIPMRKRRPYTPFDPTSLPQTSQETLLRLLSVVAAGGVDLPEEMLAEISAISLRGVDPQWQIDQLERILDRWARRH